MERNPGQGDLARAVADFKVTISVRMRAIEKGQKKIGDDIAKVGMKLDRMESDLAIIKEHLVTRMRADDAEDEEEDDSEDGTICPRFVAKGLNLTLAQSRVAAALAEGLTVPEIALAIGCKSSTIRWNLRKINRRLKISRQHQLVRLVLLLPRRNDRQPDAHD